MADYTGPMCEDKINNCVSNSCKNEGMCIDGINSFQCVCKEGFTDELCSTNIDNCTGVLACGSGQCIDLVHNYTCVCPPDSRSSPTCMCYPGYCLNGGNCTNINGYAECICTYGYNGTRCELDVDLCMVTPFMCLNNGECYEDITNNTALCNCLPDYTGDRCQYPIDPCSLAPCANNGNCTALGLHQFRCACQRGYTGDKCEHRIDPCDFSPCLNGATCISNLTSIIIDEVLLYS